MFSKSCEYAIRAAVFVATRSLKGERCSIDDVATETGAPAAFTGKILQKLSRRHIISSVKGPGGGFLISKSDMKRTKVADIVNLMDGDSVFAGCALGLSACNEKNPCPLHDQFKNIRSGLKQLLEKTSLYDLAADVNKGDSVLRIH